MVTSIKLSSLEDLEAVVCELDYRAPAMFSFVGAANLADAAVIYRRLQIHLDRSKGNWGVHEAGMKMLCRAAEHYEKLDLLEILLDLVELDLKEGITLRDSRFQGVRSSANDVVSSAHLNSSLTVLDRVTIEAQRLARVTKALGFGGMDVVLPEVMDQDLDWLSAEATEHLIGAADGLEALNLDNNKDDLHGGGPGGAEAQMEDGVGSNKAAEHLVGAADGLEALNLDNNKHDLPGAEAQMEDRVGSNKAAQAEPKDDGAVVAYQRWALKKEEVVVALLSAKASKIRQAISTAKKGPCLM